MNRSTQVLFGIAATSLSAWAQGTVRVSVDSAGVQGDQNSYGGVCSMDARYVAFASSATNLVAGDTNGTRDCFVRDRVAGTTERVNLGPAGVQGNGDSYPTAITPDGRFVVFISAATNLVAGDTNQTHDIFVRDRQTGTTERVSVSSGGVESNGYCSSASISADGNFVAFASLATNLVQNDTNNSTDVFLRDRAAGTTVRVSLDSAGAQGNDASDSASISSDGHFVAFSSAATNLVAGDTNTSRDIFVRDLQAGTTERVSVGTAGTQGNNQSNWPSISADGRYVAFGSSASNLSANDGNPALDVYVRDRLAGTTQLASTDSAGTVGDAQSLYPAISLDGQSVTFSSQAANLVPNDTNGAWDVFVHDRVTGATERASVGPGGVQASLSSQSSTLSGNGRYVCFQSSAANLVAGDTNARDDAFLCDRILVGYLSLCEPTSAGVLDCPCANQPSGPGRGCNNSAATGGAALAADGLASLAADTLVFTTSGEMPTATSILLQGDAANPGGQVLGQGVRCVVGAIRRLYVKTAVSGSITAPQIPSGDATVSARSAALGDPIAPVSTRWYLVYYRDPTVLGTCSAQSTYNTTQTFAIRWWP